MDEGMILLEADNQRPGRGKRTEALGDRVDGSGGSGGVKFWGTNGGLEVMGLVGLVGYG